MSAIEESLVREFFEQQGFLVRQIAKHQARGRAPAASEALDLLVYNPRPEGGGFSGDFVAFPSVLRSVRRAVVSVVAWHSERLTPARIRRAPELFQIAGASAREEAERHFPSGAGEELFPELTQLLVVPGLPDAAEARAESIRMLRQRGIDAVLTFRTLLVDLIDRVEVNRDYRKSDLLQFLRLLKNYGLVTSTQLDLQLPKAAGRAGR